MKSPANMPKTTSYSIVIDQPSFFQAARSVLVDETTFAIGQVRRRPLGTTTELIVGQWRVLNAPPNGDSFAPLMDWAVLSASPDIGNPQTLLQRVHPRKSHLVIGVRLDGSDHDRLAVEVMDHATICSPHEIRFIGSGLITLPEPIPAADYSLRASRTAGALGKLFDRLRSLSVAVVGAGRGGQELARQLVAAGIRRLTLIDGDTLNLENLDAMPLSRIGDLGAGKAQQLADALVQNQSELSVNVVGHSVIASESLNVLRGRRFDTVFSFVDNDVARLAVSRVCADTKTVHLDIGTSIQREDQSVHAALRQTGIDVRLFQPGRGCVACVPAMQQMDDVLYELAAPPDALLRGRPMLWHEQRSGSLLHINSIAAGLAIDSWIDWLSGTIGDSFWLRAGWGSGQVPGMDRSLVGPADDCRFCK